MKILWKRLKGLMSLLIVWILLPFFVIFEEIRNALENMHVINNVKDKYISITSEFIEFWKYDFDVEKINNSRKKAKIDKLFRD